MHAAPRNVLALVVALLVTSVGMVDAAIGGQVDLVVVLAVAAALQAVALVGLWAGPRPVHLRADLAAWAERHAVATGEPAERIVARCVAAYRAGLTVDSGEHRDRG